MILLRILDHDLHKAKQEDSIPVMAETPILDNKHLPAIVSSTRGKFLVARHHVRDRPGFVAAGVFEWDSDRLDDLIGDMFVAAHSLSASEGWDNIFTGRKALDRAFNYVRSASGLAGQPHVCLIPGLWRAHAIRRHFGAKNIDDQSRKFKKNCRLVPAKVPFPVFLSRPDLVGIYTQFIGGMSSLLLHNVKLGTGFCPDLT